jgi:transcriptional regulator GlxA family with amidase domain
MKPPKRKRPVIAILGDNRGSETTDFIVPWSVLKRADIADVVAVSTRSGAIQLMPALKVMPDMTIAQFDAAYPDGADYVIVPAFHDPKNKTALAWIRKQASAKASIAGICSGALVLAQAGVLSGRNATTHWYDRKKLTRISPTTTLALDQRYVADQNIMTTTGVSASLPFTLTLVEAIAGKTEADNLAARLGVSSYDSSHQSGEFRLSTNSVSRVVANAVNVFAHEDLGQHLQDGIDELPLAFAADAWSRTYRSKCLAFSDATSVRTLNGMQILPDLSKAEGMALTPLPAIGAKPGLVLNETLEQISRRYGAPTASLVALQLEHLWEPMSDRT